MSFVRISLLAAEFIGCARDEDMLLIFPACRSSMFPEFGHAFPRVSVWTTLLLLMCTIARD